MRYHQLATAVVDKNSAEVKRQLALLLDEFTKASARSSLKKELNTPFQLPGQSKARCLLRIAFDQADVATFAELITQPIIDLPKCDSRYTAQSHNTDLTITFNDAERIEIDPKNTPQVEMWQAAKKCQTAAELHQKTTGTAKEGHWDKLPSLFKKSSSSLYYGSITKIKLLARQQSATGPLPDSMLYRRESPDFLSLEALQQDRPITSLTFGHKGHGLYNKRLSAQSPTLGRAASEVEFVSGYAQNAVTSRLFESHTCLAHNITPNSGSRIHSEAPVQGFAATSAWVRDRAGGSCKGGKPTLRKHEAKLAKKRNRSEEKTAWYPSGASKRPKINEDLRTLRAFKRVASANEVLGITRSSQRVDAAEPTGVADDVRCVVISTTVYQGHRLGNLLTAVNTQIELAQNKATQKHVPIAFYDHITGTPHLLSEGAVALLVKLFILTIRLPSGGVNLDLDVPHFIQQKYGKTLLAFLTEPVTAETTQEILQSADVILTQHYSHRYFKEELRDGLERTASGILYYKPYLSREFNRHLVAHFTQKQVMLGGEVSSDEPAALAAAAAAATLSETPARPHSRSTSTSPSPVNFRLFRCKTPTQTGDTVARFLPELTEFKTYWRDGTTDLPEALLYILAHGVINTPYEDDPKDVQTVYADPDRSETLLNYHPNHDVAFALRKLAYTRLLVALLSDPTQCRPKFKFKIGVRIFECKNDVISKFSDEERALLNLVVFLERCGRTNEQPGPKDPSNAKRSLELIETIALDLGFSPQLINSMMYNSRYDVTDVKKEGFTQEGYRTYKAILFQAIKTMAHNCDLGRCRGDRAQKDSSIGFVKGLLGKALVPYVPSTKKRSVIDTLSTQIKNIMKKTGVSMRDDTLVYPGGKDERRHLKFRCLQSPRMVLAELVPHAQTARPKPAQFDSTLRASDASIAKPKPNRPTLI